MRKLTGQEKEIVKKISVSDHIYIDHLFSEIIKECRISCNFADNEIKIHYLNSTGKESPTLKTPEIAFKEIFVIAKLLQLLDSYGLILTVERTLNKAIDDSYSVGNYEIKEPCSSYNFGDKRLKQLFISYVTVEIYPTEELKLFVKNRHRTQEQIYQIRTLWATWAGIGVAFGLGLFTIFKDQMETKREIETMKKEIDSVKQKDHVMEDYIDHLKSDNHNRLKIDTVFHK